MNKFKKFLKKITKPTPLDKIIIGIAKPLEAGKLEDSLIIELNEKICRKQRSAPKEFHLDIFIVMFFMCFPLLFIPFMLFKSIIIFFLCIILYLPLCFLAGNFTYFLPYRELILNREEGTISLHKLFKKENVVISFEDGEGFLRLIGPSIGPYFVLTFYSKNNPANGGELANLYLEEFWDFVVWYMDKNRPLPPGTAFDPYREADFQRRKAEGFPKPLYKSYIPTPEATRRQQLERERIGKW